MPELPHKQLKVSAFVRRGGLPPSRGEITEGLGLKNRQGIDLHLRSLQRKGAIELQRDLMWWVHRHRFEILKMPAA
jgi:SOS-response transcriptional repressor LexA